MISDPHQRHSVAVMLDNENKLKQGNITNIRALLLDTSLRRLHTNSRLDLCDSHMTAA